MTNSKAVLPKRNTPILVQGSFFGGAVDIPSGSFHGGAVDVPAGSFHKPVKSNSKC